MAKLSVILYITIGIGLLFFLSQSPNHHPTPHHHRHLRRHHRRLKLRSNFTFTSQDHLDHHDPHRDFRHHHHHDPVAFDPVVAELERKQEDKQWEKMYIDEHHKDLVDHAPGHVSQPEWEDWMDNAEDYLNDEDKFNVTNRLMVLFPKIDVDPIDGFVSEKELTHWHFDQASKEVLHRTQREMEVHDKNHDGFVSFSEYEPPTWVKNSELWSEVAYGNNSLNDFCLCFPLYLTFMLTMESESSNISRAEELKLLANDAFKANKYSQAIDLYTQAIELNNQNAVYWANRAFAHTKLEEYGSAIQDATKAIEIDPKYSKA